jgi:hypothetical protein
MDNCALSLAGVRIEARATSQFNLLNPFISETIIFSAPKNPELLMT